jgi:HAE1 family hydrophobic/amphiphilic exporter-1
MAFAVIGLFSLLELGIDMFPKIEFPFVTVVTLYPGAGPEEIETLITKPIEEEVGSINGVKNITSISQEGMSLLFIEFQMEVDVDIAGIDVKEKVDAIRYELPEDILAPAISKFDINTIPILDLAVSSKRPLEEVYKYCEDVIKPEMGKIQGLASIELTGGKEREIRIEVDKNALAARGLSLYQVIGAISGENLNVPSGHIVDGRKEYSIRMAGEFSSLEEIRDLKIPSGNGAPVKMTDIAQVEDDFKEIRELARFNSEVSVGVSLVKRSDANTVQVSDEAFKSLERLKKQLPEDITIDIARDRSQVIKDSVSDVTSNLIMGILLTSLVILLFLQSWKSTVVAAVSMPISVVSTFTLLRFMGFTLNMMSLMGLAISVGVFVANSIVVLENIERHRGLGLGLKEAAAKGTSEIAIAVAASTLTNVVVFVPIAFMSGITGQFFREFGLTVTFATMFSLLISFTLTPMMASMTLKKYVYGIFVLVTIYFTYSSIGWLTTLIVALVAGIFVIMQQTGYKRKFDQSWEDTYQKFQAYYKRTLTWAIGHRKTIVFSIIGIFVISLGLGAFIGSEFFPPSDQGQFSISLEMPSGSSLAETDKVLHRIEDVLGKEGYIESIYTALGTTEAGGFSVNEGVNLGVLVVQLVEADERDLSTDEFIEQLRPKLADIPAAKLIIQAVGFMFGSEAPLQIEITGPDMNKLNELSQEVFAIARGVPGLVDVTSSFKVGKPELEIVPKREEIYDLELSAGQVAMSLRNMIEGSVASKFREGGDEYDIRVKLSERDRANLQNVDDYLIPTQDGNVQLARVADIRHTEGPSSIYRKNKQRMIIISSNLAGMTLGQAQNILEQRFKEINIPEGYKVYFGGQSEAMAESFGEMFKALILASVLTYMLMAAILESYKNPFIIMLTLPLALIGVVLSLLITAKTLSMLSLMAIVMLVGIVVNNGILLIDYMTVLRKEGLGLREAIIEACPIRLRPIIMTNIAAIASMLPLALGLGAGGEFRSSMAVVSIGGLVTSTIFTLYLIPVMYASFEGIRKLEKT